jgi:hypothetical protein
VDGDATRQLLPSMGAVSSRKEAVLGLSTGREQVRAPREDVVKHD